MQTQVANTALPPIVLAEAEADILADLAIAARERSPLAAGLLLLEIERASTAGTGKVPRDVVRMMSRVDFVDEDSAERHSVELVYPKDADTDLHRISVLTPIGAALIGMRCGEAIEWVDLRGARRRLRIVEVAQGAAGG
jgi:regulator of nucleoside diphosphate kinase